MRTKSISHSTAIRFICENLEDTGANSARCRAIRKHIRECPDCSHQLERVKQTIALYRKYPEPGLTAAAKKRLRGKLNL